MEIDDETRPGAPTHGRPAAEDLVGLRAWYLEAAAKLVEQLGEHEDAPVGEFGRGYQHAIGVAVAAIRRAIR